MHLYESQPSIVLCAVQYLRLYIACSYLACELWPLCWPFWPFNDLSYSHWRSLTYATVAWLNMISRTACEISYTLDIVVYISAGIDDSRFRRLSRAQLQSANHESGPKSKNTRRFGYILGGRILRNGVTKLSDKWYKKFQSRCSMFPPWAASMSSKQQRDWSICNSLPPALRSCNSPDTYRRHIKTHYFQQTFSWP